MSSRPVEAAPPPGAHRAWALVLAAGEGTRLQSLTTTASGVAVPKQFCSFGGDGSLLHDALERARTIAPPERICVIVAEQHRQWWSELAESIPARNIIVQPRNRGTANGILLPLLHIYQRDPHATLIVLPSDHYVREEAELTHGMRNAIDHVEHGDAGLVLLGFTPDEPDTELGYIVPAEKAGPSARKVRHFVEKPCSATARALIEKGGLWNSFIFAAQAQKLLQAFERRCPEVLSDMRAVLASAEDDEMTFARLSALYERLPSLDFSRDIVAKDASRLLVIRAPACGWSDLGTPQRVAEAVIRGARRAPAASAVIHSRGFLDLIAQHARPQLF